MNDDYDFGVFADPPAAVKQQMKIDRIPNMFLMVPNFKPGEQGISFANVPYNREHFGGLKFKNIIKFLATAKMELTQQGKWPKAPPKESASKVCKCVCVCVGVCGCV